MEKTRVVLIVGDGGRELARILNKLAVEAFLMDNAGPVELISQEQIEMLRKKLLRIEKLPTLDDINQLIATMVLSPDQVWEGEHLPESPNHYISATRPAAWKTEYG